MMRANMPSAHTHRFTWRRFQPVVAVTLLLGICLATVSPLAAPFAYAQGVGDTGTLAPEAPPQVQPAGTTCSNAGDPFDQAKCIFFQIIAEILLIIASLLGRILVFLVDILIAFASYNDFGNTIVVDRGWVVVRDLVNMFFIVILLVSAFATIIGYDEGSFHYKRVLPKLLLMAVLINFSKTLILLLVDFSQVMMLTFVNAFQQAGPGNLVAALKIDSVLKMAPPTAAAGTDAIGTAQAQVGTVDQTNLILAIMLAIFMLSISLGIVIIMVGYLIFRIVGLWIALILSPIALFATALPGRLQRGMDNFTGKYWSRLSALLTGGPVMAFFLWLTFAVTQASVGEGGGLAPALNFKVSNDAVTFLTVIGNSQDIASFIVGITLMLMGLDAAVSSAQAISETLGSFAKKTASASKALGKLAATAPYLGAYYAGRTGARYIDRRADISGKAATAAAATVGQIPILRSALRKPLAAAATRNRRLDLEEASDLQKGLEGMTPAQRAIFAASTKGIIPTGGQKMAYAQQMMERAAPKNAQAIKDQIVQTYRNQFTAEKEKELKAQGLSGAALQGALGSSQREIENRAQQYADRDVAARQSYFLDKAKEQAVSAGDQDMVRSIDEQLKKNPHLAKQKREIAKDLLADKKALNGMSDQAKGDVGVHAALLVESGAATVDAQGNLGNIDRAKMDALKDKITDKGTLENLEMVERYVAGQQAAGQAVNVQELNGMMIGKDEKGSTKMFQMPVKDASKGEGVAREIERAISALPGGAAVTGKTYGAAATMADFSKASMSPVMSATAKQAQEQLVQARDALQQAATPANQAALTAATERAIGQLGFKDAVSVGGPNAYTAARQRLGQQVAAGDFTIVSSLGKDIKKLSGQQQTELIAEATVSNMLQEYINARAQGRTTKGQDKAMMTIVETAASIDSEVSKRPPGAAVSAEEQRVQDLVREVRGKLNSTNQQTRNELPRAWKVVVEERET